MTFIVSDKEVFMEFENCQGGNHRWIPIYTNDSFYNHVEVVNWCSICGAIIVDMIKDGIKHKGHVELIRRPKLYSEGIVSNVYPGTSFSNERGNVEKARSFFAQVDESFIGKLLDSGDSVIEKKH